MASKIIPTNIDITYPIAGQDNDTKGFRDNFTNIRNNFSIAATEISAIQANVALATTVTRVPTSNSDYGTPGQIAYDSSNMYICVANATWIKIAGDTSFP